MAPLAKDDEAALGSMFTIDCMANTLHVLGEGAASDG